MPFIIKEIDNDRTKEFCVILRSIEEDARNIAAHEIATITDNWIKEKSGYTTQQIQEYLEGLFEITYPTYKKPQMWNSYDIMNDKILHGNVTYSDKSIKKLSEK